MHPKPGDEFGAHCGNQLVPLLNRPSQRRNRGKGIGIFRACDPLHAGVHRQPNPFRQHVGLGLQSGAGGSGIPRALPPVGIHAQRPPAFQPAVQKSHFVGFYDQVNGNNVCLDAGQQFGCFLVSVQVKEEGGGAVLEGFQGLGIEVFCVARTQHLQGVGIGRGPDLSIALKRFRPRRQRI